VIALAGGEAGSVVPATAAVGGVAADTTIEVWAMRSPARARTSWGPNGVSAGMVTVVWNRPEPSAVTLPKLTGVLNSVRATGALGGKFWPASDSWPPGAS